MGHFPHPSKTEEVYLSNTCKDSLSQMSKITNKTPAFIYRCPFFLMYDQFWICLELRRKRFAG